MLNDYLQLLKQELESRNINDSDEIIAYFEEMISDRLDNGENLEDILHKLGEPEIVAESFGKREEDTPSFKEKETETLDFQSIHSLNIETVSYSYSFLPSADSLFHITYEKDESTSLNISASHNRHGEDIEIEQDFSEFNLGNILLRWADRKNKKTRDIKYQAWISIPMQQKTDLEIDNVSGDLYFKDICLADTEIDNVSGRITMESVSFRSLECSSVSGTINMEDLKIEEDLEIDSTSGDIQAERILCEEIDINTVSADVDLTMIGSKQDFDIEISKLRSSESYEGDGDLSLSIHTISGKISYRFTEE